MPVFDQILVNLFKGATIRLVGTRYYSLSSRITLVSPPLVCEAVT